MHVRPDAIEKESLAECEAAEFAGECSKDCLRTSKSCWQESGVRSADCAALAFQKFMGRP
jgi:hypothetical protein